VGERRRANHEMCRSIWEEKAGSAGSVGSGAKTNKRQVRRRTAEKIQQTLSE
jgi:hypothetical protein